MAYIWVFITKGEAELERDLWQVGSHHDELRKASYPFAIEKLGEKNVSRANDSL